jgi:serine phosphatase RsbU (regulator of sigma subunit)
MVNYEWLGGSLAKLLTLVSNGLTAACLLLLALEIAGHRRVNNIHRVAIFFGVPLLSVPLLFADDMVFLKSDAIFDFASSALAALMILTGIWIALREKADSLQGNLPTASSFLSTELPLTITKLSLASCGLVIYAHANFKDLTQVQNNGFKDFLDWQHLVLLPTLIAACLIDVGSTSRKMFAFARSMVKKAMLERELELGKEVQQKMLPPRRSEAAGFAWRSMYLPASALAGDWYDVRELVFSDGTSCLVACLADVTGHGAGAALSTGVISAQWGLWCQWAAKQQNRPTTQQESAEILSQAPARINEGLLALRSNENCTAIFMLFDASTRSVTVCSAGHPGALLWNGDRFEYLMGRGDRLGAGIPEQPWVAITKELRPGSLVVVFSDGLVPIGKTVSSWISGLSRQVRRDQHKPFGLMLAQQVRENRRAFKTSVRAEDDITVVAVGFAAEEQQASAPDERPSSMNAQPLGA